MSLQQLRNIKDGDLRRSSTSPPTSINTYAKVVSVYDGDTCDLVFIQNGSFQRFKTRLLAINAPEVATGDRAFKSRDFLAWLCLGKDPSSFPRQTKPWSEHQLQSMLNANHELVYAEFNGTGGFGRPLVTLKSNPGSSKSFNSLLLEYGYASRYQ